MSLRISIEFRRDEGIFSGQQINKKQLLRDVAAALEQEGAEALAGPFDRDGASVFQVTLDDSRLQWAAGKPAHPTSSTDHD